LKSYDINTLLKWQSGHIPKFVEPDFHNGNTIALLFAEVG